MNTENKNLWEGWWRWPLVPVVVIITIFLVPLVIDFFSYLNNQINGIDRSPGLITIYLAPAFKAAITGYLTIRAGCYVAPRGKIIVGIVTVTTITLLILIFWSFLINFLIQTPDNNEVSTGKLVWLGIYTLVFIIASISSIVSVREDILDS